MKDEGPLVKPGGAEVEGKAWNPNKRKGKKKK